MEPLERAMFRTGGSATGGEHILALSVAELSLGEMGCPGQIQKLVRGYGFHTCLA